MAVTHVANTRSNIASQVLTDLGVNAEMVLRDSGDSELATLPTPNPSGTVAGAVLTFGTFTDDTNANAGTCTYIAMETSGGSEVYRFNATGDGVTLSSTTIGAGDTVQCSAHTYTAPV